MTCIGRIREAIESPDGWDTSQIKPCAHCHLLIACAFGASKVLDHVSIRDARKRYPCLLPKGRKL